MVGACAQSTARQAVNGKSKYTIF